MIVGMSVVLNITVVDSDWCFDNQGGVVESWVKITQGKCEIWIQNWSPKRQIQFNFFFVYKLMIALKGIKKTIRENVFEQEKREHEVQFNPVFALIVLQTTGCPVL